MPKTYRGIAEKHIHIPDWELVVEEAARLYQNYRAEWGYAHGQAVRAMVADMRQKFEPHANG